jgi:hypothetical protein
LDALLTFKFPRVGTFAHAHPLLQRTLDCEATITTVIPAKDLFGERSKDERALAKDSIKLIKEAIQRQEPVTIMGSVWCIEAMVSTFENTSYSPHFPSPI